jgi:hypothetical protein
MNQLAAASERAAGWIDRVRDADDGQEFSNQDSKDAR